MYTVLVGTATTMVEQPLPPLQTVLVTGTESSWDVHASQEPELPLDDHGPQVPVGAGVVLDFLGSHTVQVDAAVVAAWPGVQKFHATSESSMGVIGVNVAWMDVPVEVPVPVETLVDVSVYVPVEAAVVVPL